jgi:hypothetical protein
LFLYAAAARCTDLNFFTVFTAAYKNISVQRRIFFKMHIIKEQLSALLRGLFQHKRRGVLSFYNCSLHRPPPPSAL